MSDPVLIKLKTDAGIVLADLWRALTRQAPVESQEGPHSKAGPADSEKPPTGRRGEEPKQSNFCCVHLN